MRKPEQSPFARQALAYFLRLYEGNDLPEGRRLLSSVQSVQFGKRRLTPEEARWVAQQLVESRRPGYWQVLWQLVTRPERASPESDLSEPARSVSAVEALTNILRTPQRSLVASLIPKGKTYGAEAGKPTVAGSWSEAYASDPTFGSILEAWVPGMPRTVRQVSGVAGDVVIDPLSLLGALGIVGRGAKSFGLTRQASQLAQRLSQSGVFVARRAGEVLSRELPALWFLDRAASENLARWLGLNAAEASRSSSPFRVLGLALNLLLDPSATKEAIKEARAADAGGRVSKAFEYLAQAQELRRRVASEVGPTAAKEAVAQRHAFRGIPDAALESARKVARELPDDHPDVQALRRVEEAVSRSPGREGISYAVAQDVESVYRLAERGGWKPPQTVTQKVRRVEEDIAKEQGGLSEAARREAERLKQSARLSPDVLDKALSLWKSTKTVLNPPSFVRNFLQNFILRHLEGEPTANIPSAVARLLRDPKRFRELWEQTEIASGKIQDVGVRGLFGKAMDQMAEWYEGADRLAAVILSEATGKPPTAFLMNYGEIPETLDFLRRRGIAPFIAWQYFAVPAVLRGLVNAPQRARQVGQALTALQPDSKKVGERVQVGDRETSVGNILPLNPADYGGDMQILDPRNAPLVQLAMSLTDIRSGKGYRAMGDTERRTGWEGLAMLMKDFWLPPALGYYLPGVVRPPETKPGQRRARERMDYVFGLLGFPTRPVDASADMRSEAWRQIEQNRRQAQELMRLLPSVGDGTSGR